MAKIFGYVLMLLGLALIASKFILRDNSLLAKINVLFAIIIGLILILAGFLFLREGNEKQEEEVPIYRGEGKKRKIVGYRRVK